MEIALCWGLLCVRDAVCLGCSVWVLQRAAVCRSFDMWVLQSGVALCWSSGVWRSQCLEVAINGSGLLELGSVRFSV